MHFRKHKLVAIICTGVINKSNSNCNKGLLTRFYMVKYHFDCNEFNVLERFLASSEDNMLKLSLTAKI